MLRWQLSTPILAIVPFLMHGEFTDIESIAWSEAFVANIIGSLIFYNVDKKIFKK